MKNPLRDRVLSRPLDVKQIRKRIGLTQGQFCDRYWIPLRTLQGWERKRAVPDGTTIVYLRLIERHPNMISELIAALTLKAS